MSDKEEIRGIYVSDPRNSLKHPFQQRLSVTCTALSYTSALCSYSLRTSHTGHFRNKQLPTTCADTASAFSVIFPSIIIRKIPIFYFISLISRSIF